MMKRIAGIAFMIGLSFSGVTAQMAIDSLPTGQLWGLEECMRYAVENSPAAVRQQLATANLGADYTQAILNHLPSLNGSVGATANFGRNINPADNTYTNTSTFGNTYGLSAGMTLFNGLYLLNNTRIARISKLRGVQEQQKVEDDIALNAMQAYFELSYAMGSVDLAREQLETSKVTLVQTRRMMDLGLKSAADLAQIEAELANQEYNLVRMENNLRTKELQLKETMNFPLEDRLVIDTLARYGEPTPEASDIQDMVDYAIKLLPKAQISLMDVRIYKINYNGSYWRLLPSISASGGIGTNYYTKLSGGDGGKHFGNQFKDNYSKSFGASASIPIFQNWSRATNIRKSRNNLRNMEQVRIQNIREISVEVEQAVLDLNGALSEREQALKQVRARELAYRVAQQKYNEGLFSVIDLQTTSNQLLSTRVTLLNAELTWQGKRKLVDFYKGIPLLFAY